MGCGWQGEETVIQLYISHQLVSTATKDGMKENPVISCLCAFDVCERFPTRTSELCKQKSANETANS